jgi:hypothetical protein
VEVREFDNLITDAGLNQRGKGPTITRCQVGSGTTAPANGDTALASLVSTSAVFQAVTAPFAEFSYDVAGRRQAYTVCVRFSSGVDGIPLTEIAMGWSETPAGIWCRSLIKDGGGNPTSITLFPDEILDVYYTLTLQYPATDTTGTFTLNGTTYTWVGRPASLASPAHIGSLFNSPLCGEPNPTKTGFSGGPVLTAYSGSVGTPATYPAGTQIGSNFYLTSDTYSDGNFYRTVTHIFPPDFGNGTFQSFRMFIWPHNSYAGLEWQFGLSPSITKTNNSEMTVVTQVGWGRA